MSELALASFAARATRTSSASRAAPASRAFKAGFDARAELERCTRSASASWPAPIPASRRCCGRSTTRRRGSSCAATARQTLLARPAVAVVGARACSAYGAQVARQLGRELAAAGLVVVSGLARGVDARGARGALEAGGITVAVLGCGIDRDYPAAQPRARASRSRRAGWSSPSTQPGVEPAPWRFPARNRIVAGLCAATVVVEARERSGALITADFALEEGREVFAVPGEITSALSAGTNALLRLGATPLTQRADVLEAFGLDGGRAAAAESADRSRVLERSRGDGADELARATGLDAGRARRARWPSSSSRARSPSEDGVYRARAH